MSWKQCKKSYPELETLCKEPLPSLLIREFLKATDPISLSQCSSLGYKTNISIDEDLMHALECTLYNIFNLTAIIDVRWNYQYPVKEIRRTINLKIGDVRKALKRKNQQLVEQQQEDVFIE